MRRLAPDALPRAAALPAYDRATKGIGIVHIGLGAFTRAHQAWYTDRAMAVAGGDWMIAGVSLRGAAAGEQLNPQAGLYTLAERSGEGIDLRIVGSLNEVLLATSQRHSVLLRLIAPTTHIVTFTVTEKGYCRKPDGSLDLALAEQGFYPLLAEAMLERKTAGIGGLTLLSCDNLADNGHQLQRLMSAYLSARAPDLVGWFEAECRCPCSMVDRIVPAVTAADRDAVEGILGLRDEGTVLTEPFSQWVIEDRFAGPRPAWDQVGVQIVADVTPFETAKLRMLNGAHSALAYCGLLAGYAFVHEAVGDPALRALVDQLMRKEAAPTIDPASGQDLDAYADALIARFANPALNHRLIQIAMDGSQKIPQRWLATLAANQRAGRTCPALIEAIGAWIAHLDGANTTRWGKVHDPRGDELTRIVQQSGRHRAMAALFGPQGVLASAWSPPADPERIV